MADWLDKEFHDLKKRIKWDFKDLEEEEHVTTPLINLKDGSDSLIVKVVLPDVSRKDIHLKISKDHIELRAKRKMAHEVKKKGYHKMENKYINYYREINLPNSVAHKNAKVEFSNGLLRITLPKIRKK